MNALVTQLGCQGVFPSALSEKTKPSPLVSPQGPTASPPDPREQTLSQPRHDGLAAGLTGYNVAVPIRSETDQEPRRLGPAPWSGPDTGRQQNLGRPYPRGTAQMANLR